MQTQSSRTDVSDKRGRPLHDLRISVTDRCNFRCTYCMPKEIFGPDFAFLPQSQLLSFEELLRVVRLFAQMGVRKIRITGGEPLLRRDLETLIQMISEVDGIEDIALTTNGSLLTYQKALALKQAGVHRVNISLDSLDDAVFQALNDVRFPVSKVLSAIEAAQAAGLNPVKVNMVVKKGFNDSSVLPMAEHFRGTGVIVRYIEYMDVGNSNGWRMDDVVSAADILGQINAAWPLVEVPPKQLGEVATRFQYADGQGEIGVIASVTRPFCGGCSRARLSSDGQLYTCLFGSSGHNLKQLLRGEANDTDVLQALQSIWGARTDRYSEVRSQAAGTRSKVEMSKIGG